MHPHPGGTIGDWVVSRPWPQTDGDGSAWIGADRDGSGWIRMDRDGSGWIGMDRDGSGWIGMEGDCASAINASPTAGTCLRFASPSLPSPICQSCMSPTDTHSLARVAFSLRARVCALVPRSRSRSHSSAAQSTRSTRSTAACAPAVHSISVRVGHACSRACHPTPHTPHTTHRHNESALVWKRG
jgi:hypothetical protein